MKSLLLLAAALFLLQTLPSRAAEAPTNAKAAPTPGGELVATEWAGDTLLGSPVALTLDNQGRVYVTQTTRRKQSELDIRAHADWVTKTLSFESVEDRRKFYEEEMTPARSESLPRVADTVRDSSARISIGVAPYLSTRATLLASACLKLPVIRICAESNDACWGTGAEMT